MPSYSYISVDDSGKEIKGKMNANNPLDLETRLRDLKLELVDYKAENVSKKPGVIVVRFNLSGKLVCVSF